jgi:hypothetical protein
MANKKVKVVLELEMELYEYDPEEPEKVDTQELLAGVREGVDTELASFLDDLGFAHVEDIKILKCELGGI